MTQFEIPRVFQANPSPLKKKTFLILGLAGAGALTAALLGWGPAEQRAYYFGGGITAMAFSIRFWTMQVSGGPTALTFNNSGLSLGNQTSTTAIAWADLAAINYHVSSSGHRWLFTRRDGTVAEFYLDGLTGAQRQELEQTITSIQVPDIKVVPFYDPLGLSKAA